VRIRFGPAINLSGYFNQRINRRLVEEVAALVRRRMLALGEVSTRNTLSSGIRKQEESMSSATATDLTRKRCLPCEGGIPRLEEDQVQHYLASLPGWKRTGDGQRIRREWRVKDFLTGLDFFQRVAQLAEEENHHPDLHLTGYRNVAIEIWTHAVGGLTENDFILAAKIDTLPVALKK
jgi:4a-hydroxytetrahydrobiopterin dehydratase